MKDEFTWDGTERGLENLLIWWCTREPFEHSDGCTAPDNTLHCCQGKNNDKWWGYGIESVGFGSPEREPLNLTFINNVKRTKTDMKPGDKLVYLGQYMFMLEQS